VGAESQRVELAWIDWASPRAVDFWPVHGGPVTVLEDTALYRFLAQTNALYLGKVHELREAATSWLEYISNSFPHFTQHSASHSQEIVRQISKLLFRGGEHDQAVLELSSVEAYVLVAAAYLHDTGMVVSDSDKARLLGAEEWRDWVAEGGPGHDRWLRIEAFRRGGEPADGALRHFLADVQLRYLLADYFRRTHHERLVPILHERQGQLGRFALDDPSLLETISAVCVGHGLTWAELEDRYRFPDRRDVRGEDINVRLMTVLLRLGDLLDLRHERACPLLVSAASPLPPESVAHWSQYQRVRHRDTAPESIAIEAECETADEHRLLQDWCQWICDEVAHAPTVLAGSRRHGRWAPPIAKMTGPAPTISIRPVRGATYIPSRWTFELDSEAVVTRLVESVSPEPLLFLRELLQNAFDATRCRLEDINRERDADPRAPAAEDVDHLPITVRLYDEVVANPLSGEAEPAQVIEVSDCGVGMDSETIERYLLQIGRSFYTTQAFRRSYSFNPTSRFGIGFLSVFRDSDHVVVETATAKPTTRDGLSGLRLTLTGPRTYLLVERSSRSHPGTTIRVRLRTPVAGRLVRTLVANLCRRVEFPVLCHLDGEVTAIRAEQPSDFTWIADAPGSPGTRAEVRALPFAGEGVAGELYVAVLGSGADNESWAERYWLSSGYLEEHPGAALPPLPESSVCFNGLAIASIVGFGPRGVPLSDALCVRMDYRRPLPDLGLARAATAIGPRFALDDDVVAKAWESALSSHLASTALAHGPDSWQYKQRLMEQFPLDDWWRRQPATVPYYAEGVRGCSSISGLLDCDVISVLMFTAEYSTPAGLEPTLTPQRVTTRQLSRGPGVPVMVDWEVNRFSELARTAVFIGRAVSSVRLVGRRFVAVDWARSRERVDPPLGHDLLIAPLSTRDIIGFRLHRTRGRREPCVVNSRSEFVQWLLRVKAAAATEGRPVSTRQYDALIAALETPLRLGGYKRANLKTHLAGWAAGTLPPELRPPDIEITERSFVPPNDQGPLPLRYRRHRGQRGVH
jgi:molecular chaperone HtpG